MSSACKHMILRGNPCHLVWDDKFIVNAKKTDIEQYTNYTHIFCKRKECVEHLGLQIFDKYPDDFFFENQCSICLENIKKEESYTTNSCGHIFHKGCLKEWINPRNSPCSANDSKIVKDTCPLCRTKVNTIETGYNSSFVTYMELEFEDSRPIYYTSKTIVIDGKELFISGDKIYKLFKSSPSKWAVHNSEHFQPIYELSPGIFISSWLRILLLFGDRIIMAETQETLDKNYIKAADDTFKCGQHEVSYDSYFKIFNWVFDVMHDLSRNKGLEYSLNLNSKIINIIFIAFKQIRITSKTYQLVALCAMHIVHKEVLDYSYLNDFTTNIYTPEKIKEFTKTLKIAIKPYGLC